MSGTNIVFPESLGCPLRASYAGEAEPRFSMIDVVDGPPRFRLLGSDERRLWTVSFAWSWDQVQIFEGFVAADLNMGLEWFMMNHLTGQGMTAHYCHLVGDYVIQAIPNSVTHFDVTFQVEAFLRPQDVPPPFVFDNDYDGGVAGGVVPVDIIDSQEADQPPPPDRIDSLVPGA